MRAFDATRVEAVLRRAVEQARFNHEGAPAMYIPELAVVPLDSTSAAVTSVDGTVVTAGDSATHRFTLQSAAKLILLIGMMEEQGSDAVFSVVGSEPSGSSFASLARLETHGPLPANPLINAGAIALCGQLEGTAAERVAWVERWAARLCGRPLPINERVLRSERRTGHRNRAIAHMLKSTDVLAGEVDDALETYFALCSLEADVAAASRLPAVLAAGGVDPSGQRVVSVEVAEQVLALMATCGMYDESGVHLRTTGLPAKSGVSGVIVAVALGRAGIAVASPRLNHKGGSIRGHLVLRQIASELDWHFGRIPST